MTLDVLVTGATGFTGRRVVRALLALVRGRPVVTGEQLLRLDEDKATDISPAAAAFRFSPRPFEQGAREEAAALGCLREGP